MFETEYSTQILASLMIATLLGSILVSFTTLSITGAYTIDFSKLFNLSKWFTKPIISKTPTTTTSTSSLSTCDGSVSASQYVVGYNPTTTGTDYKTSARGVTLTPANLSNILSKKTINAYVSGSSKSYQQQEEIRISYYPQSTTDFVNYNEASSPSGHGLYFKAPYGEIRYMLNFSVSGEGIPTNYTAYNEAPTITFNGYNFAIDALRLQSGNLDVYSGTRVEVTEGQTITVGNATINLQSIVQVSDASGTHFVAVIQVTKGTSTETQTVLRLTGFEFLASSGGSVPIYAEEMIYGASGGSKVILRVGGPRVTFRTGQSFTLDPSWTVDSVEIIGTPTYDPASFNHVGALRSVVLKYGNPSGATPLARGTFDGSVQNGLAKDIAVHGPKNPAGTSSWNLKSTGYCPTVHSTNVTFWGMGTPPSGTSTIKVTWTDRDGIKNELAPVDRTYLNLSAIGDDVGLVLGSLPYTVVNDKVIYFQGIDQLVSGGNTQYTPVFRIGGINGFSINGDTVTSNFTPSSSNQLISKISYTGGTSGTKLECQVLITGAASVTLKSSATCDLKPDYVTVGPKSTFSKATATSAPALDLRYVGSNNGNMLTVDNNNRPYVSVYDPALSGLSSVFNVWYDDTSASSGDDNGTTTGLKSYRSSIPTTPPGVQNTFVYIDQSKTTIYEPDQYHISEGGSELSTVNNSILTVTLYESVPSSLVVINAENTTITPPSPLTAFSIESCNGYESTIRNTGDTTLTANADIYNAANDNKIGYFNFASKNLAAGAVSKYSIYDNTGLPRTSTNAVTGTLKIIDPDYPAYRFVCSTGAAFSINSCNGYSASIKNTGTTKLTANADIYDSTGKKVGYLNFGRTNIDISATATVAIYNIYNAQLTQYSAIIGNFKITDSDYPEYALACSSGKDTTKPQITEDYVTPTSIGIYDGATHRISATDNVGLKKIEFIEPDADVGTGIVSTTCDISGTTATCTVRTEQKLSSGYIYPKVSSASCVVTSNGKSATCTATLIVGNTFTYSARVTDTSSNVQTDTYSTETVRPLNVQYATKGPDPSVVGNTIGIIHPWNDGSTFWAINVYVDGQKKTTGISATYTCGGTSSGLSAGSCYILTSDKIGSSHTYYAEGFDTHGVLVISDPQAGTKSYTAQ